MNVGLRVWSVLVAAVACAVLVGGAACGGDDDTSSAEGEGAAALMQELGGPVDLGTPTQGGTLRIATVDLANTAQFDPTGEYFFHTGLKAITRTLLGYRATAGAAGDELVPDLAEAQPEISADGLTYTFRLREGVRFGPPVNREITSRDVAYAMRRIATPGLAQYAFYYTVIDGFQDVLDGKADRIRGISTPDDRTIVFRLTEPRGDFPFAFSLPATAPIPEEVARCHADPHEYGRYVISSGAYMIEGSEDLDISSCGSQRPLRGLDLIRGATFVRNPNYDPATDPERDPANYPDRIRIIVNTNTADIYAKIARGEYDGSFDRPPGATARRYLQDPGLRPRLRVNSQDATWYIAMNLTQPPFDDVHVRRAMNMVMDLAGLQRAWGGPVSGEIATDVVPDGILGDDMRTASYHPFQDPPYDGDPEAAAAEMKLSRYDTDGDGVCDAPECRGIVLITRNQPVWKQMTPIIKASAARIGVGLSPREVPPTVAYGTAGDVKKGIPISTHAGFGKDYADARTTIVPLHDGRSIIPEGNGNLGLVGLTPAQARELGVRLPAGGPPPSVDRDIDRCLTTSGEERTACWTALDRRITEEVVPWVPYLDSTNLDVLGPAVTHYDFDQSAGEMALTETAVDPAKQR